MAFGGSAIAEDVAQEAFVRGFRFLRQHRSDAPLRPWLLAIVANVARNQRRATFRWTRAGERYVATGRSESPEEHAVAGSRREELWAALDALPGRQRDVVVCRYLLDLSEEETARVLGIARGTSKSRLARALDLLERLLPREVLDD